MMHMQSPTTSPQEATASERSATMASIEFNYLTAAGRQTIAITAPTIGACYADFAAQVPMGSIEKLLYTRTMTPIEPLVVFG